MADNKAITPGKGTSKALATPNVAKLDVGAQVGVQRNAAFSAGGRARKFTRNAYVGYRTTFDPVSGLISEGDK